MSKSMICAIASICVASVAFTPCICHAKSVTTEVIIKCSIDHKIAPWKKWKGNPKGKYTLVTKGMYEKGYDWLILDWLENVPGMTKRHGAGVLGGSLLDIVATCTPDKGKDHWMQMDKPGTILKCAKGEGIAISMLSPNSEDPEQFKYVADLIADWDDEEETAAVVKQVPIQTQSNVSNMAASGNGILLKQQPATINLSPAPAVVTKTGGGTSCSCMLL